jgi:hypothetical protein
MAEIILKNILSAAKSDDEKEREEWLQKRCGNFTASTIWKLMEEGKNGKMFSNAGEKQIKCNAIEKLSGKPLPSGGRGIAAIQGIENEAGGLELLGIEQNKTFFKHKTLSFGATPDAIKVIGGETWTYDIKHPHAGDTKYEYMTIKSFKDLYYINKEYFYQVIGQILALGASIGYLIIRDLMTGKYNLIVVHRHEVADIIENMTQRIVEAEKLRDMFVANYQANAKSVEEARQLI